LAPASDIPPACPHYKRMILGSLLGRMVLPSLVLLPLIVLSVKYINMSIMQDPIFLITSFLLITSPPAIQLSQICQLNELYQKEMAGVLFYGYAILTLPVTIIVVVTCIEAMKWANP
jgi:auxin efflux carrier family protein